MGVTIKDVAKAAGVSTATVSRVINNNPLISPDTVEKVRRIMREMKYFPSSIARGFSNRSTYNIALIIDMENTSAFVNPFFYLIQYGIERMICSHGYNLIIANQRTHIGRETALNRIILEKRADGIIFPAFLLKKNIVNKTEEEKIPFIVLGEPENKFNVNWVDINNRMGGYIAATHLIQNGYKKIAFISSDLNDTYNKNRYVGYLDALKECGIEYIQEFILKNVSGKDCGHTAARQLLEAENPPDSFVFTNNIPAFGAIQAIKEKGLRIPGDIGVVSFDNYPVAEFSDPPMTIVDIDVVELGIQAASMILKEIERPSSSKQNSLLSVRILSRGSAERQKSKGGVQ
jgi:DNA-binding LacI/PurR family transcriptional regulator